MIENELMKKLILVLLMCVISNATGRAQQGSTANTDVVTLAKKFVEMLSQNNYAGAVATFDDTVRAAMPPDKIQETWNAVISQAGGFKRQVRTRTQKSSGYDIVLVTCEFEKTLLDIKLVFDQSRHIAGLFFVPTVEELPAKYIKEGTFTEKEVTVGTPVGALPGTLTLPNGAGPFPGVVLVHGSGGNDRDESLGATKPFRDLALGLASNGIAVLRYDKRTKLYPEKLGTHFTVKDETIDDALAAVEVLRKQDNIDKKRIFVLGHSLGGMLVPRIAKLDQNVAGFIIMAGPTKPLEDAILEQSIYLFSLNGPISKPDEQRLARIKEQVAKVRHRCTDLLIWRPARILVGPAGLRTSHNSVYAEAAVVNPAR